MRTENDIPDIGEKIQQLRFEKKMTLDELAKLSGVTSSYISQVERSLINPSINKLNAIVKGLGISLGDLFNSHDQEVSYPVKTKVVRKDARKSFSLPKSNTRYYLLSPDLKRQIEFILTVAPPYSSSGEEPFSHEGEECCLILCGTMELIVNNETIILEEGDSAYFNSMLPHHWKNVSGEELKAIWVITPPSF